MTMEITKKEFWTCIVVLIALFITLMSLIKAVGFGEYDTTVLFNLGDGVEAVVSVGRQSESVNSNSYPGKPLNTIKIDPDNN